MRTGGRLGLLGCALALLAGAPAAAEDGCRRVVLDPPPDQRISGAWWSGADLLLKETARGPLLRYSLDGRRQGTVEDEGLASLVDLSASPDGSIAINGATRITARDATGRVFATYELASLPADGVRVLNAVEMVTVGEEVVTLSYAELPDGRRTEALVRARAVPYRPLRVHWTFDADWRGEIFYRLGGRHLAVAGGEVYFLRQSEPPAIVRLAEGAPQALEAFPAGFERLPRLPPARGREAVVPLFGALAAAPGAVALAGHGDHLFLLTRRPVEGGTRWTLHRIDPAADRLTASWDLPVRSSHLTMVPGAEWWAFLERGPVTAAAAQELAGVLLVPARQLAGTGKETLCD
ncbi:MAG TPA: hypothetical protein VHQ65_11950 [Thermoanaerobaculia bacterium]|nr:hypothetical protein [Thermoanaerobaculia bacterium]